MSFLSKIFVEKEGKYLNKLEPIVEKINELEKKFEGFSPEELKGQTLIFKQRINQGEKLDNLLIEAFALVREASKRTLDQRHYDVQLIGGLVLHQGKIAEMKTGEGKTLAATLPVYLNALLGRGVHVITVNDYLARRDVVWMGQIYDCLGLSVGCLNHQQAFIYDGEYRQPDEDKEIIRDRLGGFRVVEDFLRPVERKEAYRADITYGTNNEFGFDYLRDNMAYSSEDEVQRELYFAILDEIDFILIDEARTPLIISAPDTEASQRYQQLARIIPALKKEEDFEIDEERKVAALTEAGMEKAERLLGVKDIYSEAGLDHLYHLEQALRALVLFEKDKDYVVKDNEVVIVDEFTGRLMPGRRWSGGLHQAIEAKEGVMIQAESRTLASITFQNYFRQYEKLAGMTGTATTSAEEFDKVYQREVISVPTNKPMVRKDLADRVYKTEKGKYRALLAEIKEKHQLGQPLLIGTRSIERNEFLSKLLQREGITHQVLNAKNHEKEAQIIAQAGRLGQVTVATNMAGRGVDILLGGHPPVEIKSEEREVENKKEEKANNQLFEKWKEEQKKVIELGGLHVIGTERHEARRIDDQLRGRAGRQGDPGSSQFFLCLEDDLMRIFGGERVKALMERFNLPEDQPIEAKLISKAVESAQAKIEGAHFDIRKNLLDYDSVMNKHREGFYQKRKEVLTASRKQRIKDLTALAEKHSFNPEDFQFLRESEEEDFFRAEKFLFLRGLDFYWTMHLEDMEWLRESVRFQAYGNVDPLVEYKTQGYELFQEMMNETEQAFLKGLLKVRAANFPSVFPTVKRVINQQPAVKEISFKTAGLKKEKVGRNQACPCGSGKKYKKCCGKLV